MNQKMYLVVFVAFCGLAGVKAAGNDYEKTWSYKTDGNLGPENWAKAHSKCGGKSQSPINILTRDVKYHDTLGKLELKDYEHASDNMYFDMKNRNTDIAFEAKTKTGQVPQEVVFQGTTYRFYQFHFHWGSTDYKGSEHVVDYQRYAGELHLIHYNTSYPDIGAAVAQSDGLLVWGHFLKVDSENKDNRVLQNVLDNFKNAHECCNNATKVASFPLKSILPEDHSKFYHYKGSLTTPPCYESVKWIVNKNPILVSEKQMKLFRVLKNNAAKPTTNIVDNDRPAQLLNDREVQRNFKDDTESSSMLVKPVNVVLSFLALLVVFLIH